MTLARGLAGLLIALALTACAGAPQSRALLDGAAPPDLPRAAMVAGVPFFPQEDRWCGPAALATVSGWAGQPLSQEAAAALVYTPGSEGTHRSDLIAAVRRMGLLGTEVSGDLAAVLAEVAAGHPVLVFQNLGLGIAPLWHYAVVVGYDLDAGDVILRSGRDAERRTALATFEHTWARGDRWALVVTPPARLPATASEPAVLRAALGLERTGRLSEAATAYATAAEHWPSSDLARFGLGNTLLALDRPADAAQAYHAALTLRPTFAAAWNNLAHALLMAGDEDAAREAAAQALMLTPEDAAMRETARTVGGVR